MAVSPAGVSAGCLRPCVSTRRSRSASTTRAVSASTTTTSAPSPVSAARPPPTASATSAGSDRTSDEVALAPVDLDALEHLRRRPRDRLLELVQPLQEGAELELAEELLHGRAIGRRRHELVEVDLDLEVAVDGRKLFRADRVGGRRAQVLAPLLARDGVEIRVDALHRAEPNQELGRGLVADTGHSRDVVRGVALEADEVGHELRPDAVALHDPLGGVDDHVRDPARGHHDAHVLGGELERIPVGRDDADPVAGRLRLGRQRADDVVGLLARDAEVAVAERLDDRLEVRHLLAQQVGHRPAMGLVLGVQLDARRRLLVPGHEHRCRAVVGQELHQHVGHPEQRVRREPVHRLQLLRQRVEGAVGEAVAVDQEDVALLGRGVVEVQILRLSLLHRGHPSQRIRAGSRRHTPAPILFRACLATRQSPTA